MNNGSTNQACAACKFQRRRCSSDCPLARYFPAEQNQRFMNCKRLFGVSNMIRFLKEAQATDKDDTMKSFIYEADARERDPVHGCLGIVNRLKDQVAKLTEDLHSAREQLHLMEQQHIATLYQQHLAQSLVVPGTSHSPQQLIVSPAMVASYQYNVHPINGPHMGMDHVAMDEYDTRPAAFDSRSQEYNIPREPYDIPGFKYEDISLNAVPVVGQVLEHELKSAAALFSLTSNQR